MAFADKAHTVDDAVRLLRAGEFDRAEVIGRRLLKRDRRDLGALQLMASIAVERRDYEAALNRYRTCLDLRPREAKFHFLAGKVLALLGRLDEAAASLDRALALEPGHEPAAEWKATVHQWAGDYDAARAVIEPFARAGKESANMAHALARAEIHAGRYREAAALLERHLARTLPAETRHRLGHVAGDAYEKLGEHDRAFEAHTAANRAMAVRFDPAGHARYIERLIEVFSRPLIERLSARGSGSDLPVFIAGMPRSGTTLVERIIDAHPRMHGAGELRDLEAVAAGIAGESSEPYPEAVGDLEPEDPDRFARRYLDAVRGLAPAAARIADKSLENYKNLGLAAVLFRRARIIHCRREARDTCVSCYMCGILPAAHPYITDLGHLGFVYRRYERLMDHWNAVLPVPPLEVRYEALVDDLEGQARRIIDFCGLDWDDTCLRFHATGRLARTASYEQVRRPIYRTSVGRHARFERHLGPLYAALEC